MFKELKVIKLLVFVGLLTAIITKFNFSEFVIQQIYTDKTSYLPGDTVIIYASSYAPFPFSLKTSLSNLDDKTVERINIDLQNKQSKYIVPENIPSGIYLINKNFPVVIKSKKRCPITVVYPHLNNLLYKKTNTKKAKKNINKISLEESTPIDVYTKGLDLLLKKSAKGHAINYISDLDLHHKKIDTDLLVVYGKSLYWTENMRKNIVNYISENGNLLLITSYTMNYVCWYNDKLKEISFSKNKQVSLNDASSWKSHSSLNIPENILGVDFENGGISNNIYYKISAKNHPIMAGIKKDSIKINGYMYNAPAVIWKENKPYLNNAQFYKSDIIAHNRTEKEKDKVKGIFLFQPDSSSGKILSFGTDNWCLIENQEKDESLSIVTKNAVTFLLK